METVIDITLSYSGRLSDNNEIDLYDVSQAMIGFQRSLALTTHLILNNEIITQAPSLKGARIFSTPPEAGSWKVVATIATIGAGIYQAGTAPKDTPIGHLVRSGYDYVISESLGFHVDYDKSLGQQYEEIKKAKEPVAELSQSRFDSLIEKCEPAIREMHRPIIKSKTAEEAKIVAKVGKSEEPIGDLLTPETFEYLSFTERTVEHFHYRGWISSYNINTFKGRIYVPALNRPIPFELGDTARDTSTVLLIVRSLGANAETQMKGDGEIELTAFENRSRSGRLKGLLVIRANALTASN